MLDLEERPLQNMMACASTIFFQFYILFLFSFLTQCRPLSVSMGNAIKYLKLQITHTPPNMAEDQVNFVGDFVRDKWPVLANMQDTKLRGQGLRTECIIVLCSWVKLFTL